MRKLFPAIPVLLVMTLAVLWLRTPAQVRQNATAEKLKQVEAEFMQAALERGSAGYISYYAEDAAELPNGADAIVGKANIAKTMSFLDDKNNRLMWSPVGADVSSSGDLGYTWGTFEFHSKAPDGAPAVEHGKYITVWKKQADGAWKVAVDMGNSGPKER